jgi:hypothetical protein
MKRTELLAMMVLTLVVTAAAGEVYKWVDADGKVHYGDRRPASGSDPSVVELAPAPAVDADHSERSLQRRRLLDAFEAERAERREVEAKAAAAKSERKDECARARRQLAELQRAHVVYTEDESGKRIYMSDEERKATAASVRARIDEHCQ